MRQPKTGHLVQAPKKKQCTAEHPLREGVICWSRSSHPDASHWAYIMTKDGLQRVSWVD